MLKDQLYELRHLAKVYSRTKAKVICVTSGKGGVGKTNLSVNLAYAIAERGKSVILIDLDLGLANIDILLNLNPRYNIYHLISGEATIDDIITPTEKKGVSVITGASGIEEIANLDEKKRAFLLDELETLQYRADYIILDTSAGISKNVIAFASSSDQVIIIATAEPTSIIDAYAVIKLISKYSKFVSLKLLLNMVKNKDEYERLSTYFSDITRRFLNIYIEPIGFVISDKVVPISVKNKSVFIDSFPNSYAAMNIRCIAERLVKLNYSSGDKLQEESFFKKLWDTFLGKR